jgi:hypothetical protein
MTHPATVDLDDQQQLTGILQRNPALARLAGDVRTFATMMWCRRTRRLSPRPPIGKFVG